MIEQCTNCNGTGLLSQTELCPVCQGSGYVQEVEQVVTVPAQSPDDSIKAPLKTKKAVAKKAVAKKAKK